MHIICAPHADDELIGCWSLITSLSYASNSKGDFRVLYFDRMSIEREREAFNASKAFEFQPWYVTQPDEFEAICAQPNASVIAAPDPHWETHPLHKTVGQLALGMAQKHKIRFMSYSTDMNVPYLTELSKSMMQEKKEALNCYYPSQKDLWEYDHKYFLFEGICEWNPPHV